MRMIFRRSREQCLISFRSEYAQRDGIALCLNYNDKFTGRNAKQFVSRKLKYGGCTIP